MKLNQLWLVKHILQHVESSVHLENQFLLEENRILKKRLREKLVLSDQEKILFAEIDRKLGIKKLGEICTLFKPRSIMNWYYKLIRDAHTYPHDTKRGVGRPSTMGDIEIELVKTARYKTTCFLKLLKTCLKHRMHSSPGNP